MRGWAQKEKKRESIIINPCPAQIFGVKLFEVGPPFQITRLGHRIIFARALPAAKMLAAGRKAQGFRGAGRKAQHPIGQALRVKQFARMRDAIDGLDVWIAGILLVEATEGGGKFLRVARLKVLGHAEIFAEARRSASY